MKNKPREKKINRKKVENPYIVCKRSKLSNIAKLFITLHLYPNDKITTKVIMKIVIIKWHNWHKKVSLYCAFYTYYKYRQSIMQLPILHLGYKINSIQFFTLPTIFHFLYNY